MEKKIKTWIRVKQVMEFDQEVELTQKEYDILNGLEDDCISRYGDSKAFSIIEGHINFNEVFDSESEFTDFEMYNPKKNK